MTRYLTHQHKIARIMALSVIIVCLTSCSPRGLGAERALQSRTTIVEKQVPVYPEGTVTYVWEEPTREIVDIPPGLDPEGIYYRPGHQEVVETLPGRYKFYSE